MFTMNLVAAFRAGALDYNYTTSLVMTLYCIVAGGWCALPCTIIAIFVAKEVSQWHNTLCNNLTCEFVFPFFFFFFGGGGGLLFFNLFVCFLNICIVIGWLSVNNFLCVNGISLAYAIIPSLQFYDWHAHFLYEIGTVYLCCRPKRKLRRETELVLRKKARWLIGWTLLLSSSGLCQLSWKLYFW